MNELSYRVVEGWEQLPKGYVHRDVADVAVDSHDRVYLITRSDSRVIIYERDGTFVKSWGEGQLTPRAHGITVGPDDSVYCADDGDQTVRKFTPDGKLLMTLGQTGVASDTGYDITAGQQYEKLTSIKRGGPPFNRPTKAAVAPSGDIYVSDGYGNARVHRFSADGKLIQSWGEPGVGPGQFHLPHGIWVAGDGRVLVADRDNDRIQFFTPDGKYLDQWTHVQRPTSVFVDRKELVYVSELAWRLDQRSFVHGVRELYSRVCVLDSKGNVLARWGSADGCVPGCFAAPHGVVVDSHGDLYVAEVIGSWFKRGGSTLPDCHTVQKFVRQ